MICFNNYFPVEPSWFFLVSFLAFADKRHRLLKVILHVYKCVGGR